MQFGCTRKMAGNSPNVGVPLPMPLTVTYAGNLFQWNAAQQRYIQSAAPAPVAAAGKSMLEATSAHYPK